MATGRYQSLRESAKVISPASAIDQLVTRQKSLDWYYVAPYWLPNPDPVLKKQGQSISIYRDLLSDAHVGGCVRRRKAAVKSMGWQLTRNQCPARVAKEIESWLQSIDIPHLVDECLDAPLFGYAPFEIMWQQGPSLLMPWAVVGKPPEWFMFNADNELRFRSREHPFAGDALPPDKFLLASQRPTYQNPYGFPDLSLVFWPTVFKRAGLKFWARFTEKYGSPWLIGKHPRGASPTEVDDAVAAVPNDSSIEIIEAAGKGASSDLYEKFILLCRSETTIALLGQNQSMEKDSTHASALAGQAVTEDIRDDDATIVCRLVNNLIQLICRLNWGIVVAPPIFELFAKDQVDNTRATRDKTLKDAGCNFTRAYWLRTYSLEDSDIAEDAPVPVPGNLVAGNPVAGGAPLAFAEALEKAFPAQAALDDAVDKLATGGALQTQAEALLAPVFSALEGLDDKDEIAAGLLRAYPDMDVKTLTQTMMRLYFAAELVGRLTVQQELAE